MAEFQKIISYERQQQWRKVKLDAVRYLAESCCQGVDFGGCSKSDIIDSAMGLDGFSAKRIAPNVTLFMDRMDALAEIEEAHADKRSVAIRDFCIDARGRFVQERDSAEV